MGNSLNGVDGPDGHVTPGGYRDPLYTKLTGQGYDVNYVGPLNVNPSPTLTANNETRSAAFGGYTISEISQGLDGTVTPLKGTPSQGGYWLQGGNPTGPVTVKPDVILLLIGTNDFGEQYDPLYHPTATQTDVTYPYAAKYEDNNTVALHAADRFTALLNKIIGLEPQATVLVGSTLPFYLDPRIAVYDNAVENIISSSFSGDKVHYVDLYSTFDDPARTGELNPLYNSGDGIHPSAAGYDELATLWDNAILADVAIAVPEPSTYALLAMGGLGLWYFRRRVQV